ncbi:MAG: hypothetical protein IT349_08965 [Candidatus Eisenbacteria bacterium]|nr:hypothetical protein [Candidatus Eisenbacteria bacterium]
MRDVEGMSETESSRTTKLPRRPSIVDVFENFFGDDIVRLSPELVEKLHPDRGDELVDHIDAFLSAAADSWFHEDAVCLDSLANPVLVANDPTEPKTTRRAKQVGLMHREIVFPMQPLAIDHAIFGLRYPASLLSWSQVNHRLLRENIFTMIRRPNFATILDEVRAEQLLRFISDHLLESGPEDLLRRITPEGGDAEELRLAVEASVASALTDAVSAGCVRSNLAFLDEDAGDIYSALLNGDCLGDTKVNEVPLTVSLLQTLELPAIADIADQDFVAIRQESEDFAEFRDSLSRALSKTKSALDQGRPLQDAFGTSLDELRYKADQLRHAMKDKKLLPYLRKAAQTASVGAAVGTGAAAAADIAKGELLPTALAARTVAQFLAHTLFALLFYSPPTREERLLRFYNVLLGPA